MASVSVWTDADVAAGKRGRSSKVVGNQTQSFVSPYAKLGAADGDTSVLAFALLPADAVLEQLRLNSDALVGFSSVSVGVYRVGADGLTFSDTAKSDGSSAAAILRALTDMSGGYAIGSELDIMNAVPLASLGKKLWELLGFTNPGLADSRYALCFKCTTAGTAAGNLAVRGRYIQG